MRIFRIAFLLLLAFAGFISGTPSATAGGTSFGTPVYSGFVENDMEVVIYVRVYMRTLANGTVQYVYDVVVYPVGTNCPGAAGCAGLEVWTGMTPSQHEPSPTNTPQVVNEAIDPNDNGEPIWSDPADNIVINYR